VEVAGSNKDTSLQYGSINYRREKVLKYRPYVLSISQIID